MNIFSVRHRPSFFSIPEACRRLTILDLQTVLTVSQAGGIRKASVELGVAQSAVTRRIQRIEDALGVSIFERNQTGVQLTAAGIDFVAHSRRLAQEFLAAVRTARSAGAAQRGRLKIGLIASLSRGAMRDVIVEYRKEHPAIDLCFIESDRSELMTLLSHRLIDVMLAAGVAPSDHCDTLLLTKEQLYIALAKSHPLANKRCLDWSAVNGVTFIVGAEEPGPEIHDYILRRTSDLGRQAKIAEHRIEREGIMNLVGLGFGISLMCEHWRGVRYPNVKFVPLRENGVGETIPFSLTWRPENDNPALRRFLSLAREVAKADAASSGPS